MHVTGPAKKKENIKHVSIYEMKQLIPCVATVFYMVCFHTCMAQLYSSQPLLPKW